VQKTTSASPDIDAAIQRFYLIRADSYSIQELSELWCIPVSEVCAIFADELPANAIETDTDTFRVTRNAAVDAANAFQVFRMIDVERALGERFTDVRGPEFRTIPVLIHLPRCVADSILKTPMVPRTTSLSRIVEVILCEHADVANFIRAQTCTGEHT
jgi:hypothetical protein